MTGEREQLIEKLVTTLHLNLPERQSLSPLYIRHSEIAAAIGRILQRTGWFPAPLHPADGKSPVREGATLSKLPDGRFRITQQWSHALAPNVLAEKREALFDDESVAIDAFIKAEWPKGIDGIPIR